MIISNLSCAVNNDGTSNGIAFDIFVSSTPYSFDNKSDINSFTYLLSLTSPYVQPFKVFSLMHIFYFSSFRVSFIDILKYTESLGRIKLRSKVIIFIFFYKNYNRKRLYSTFIFNVSLNNCIFVTCEKLIVRIL